MPSARKNRSLIRYLSFGLLAGAALVLVRVPVLHWLDGRTNGAIPAFFLWMLCGVLWVVLCGWFVFRLVIALSGTQNKASIAAALALALVPWILPAGKRAPLDWFVSGFSRWAEANEALGTIRVTDLPPSTAAPSSPPLWWHYDDSIGRLLSVPIPPGDLTASVRALRATEARRVGDSVIFVWKPGAFGTLRFVLVCDDACEPPREIVTHMVVWNQIKRGLWTGVAIPH